MTIFQKKSLAVILSLLMALSAVGCAKTDEPSPSDSTAGSETKAAASGAAQTETETETAFMPDIEKKDYKAELNVLNPNYFLKNYCFPDQGVNDEQNAVNQVLVERAIRIKEQLGVELVHIDADWIGYGPQVTRSVQASDDAYQMVLTHPYQGIPGMIASNSLLDFKDLPSVNLEAPYWSQNVMESTKIHDKYYLGYNDFLLSEVDLITFNKDMLADQHLEEPYDLVRNRQWTLEKFISMTKGISVDVNSDGKMDKQDQYGISGWGWVPLISFVTASDIQMIVQDETGAYIPGYDAKKERLFSVIDQIYDMYNADSSFFWKSIENDSGPQLAMSTGRSLFGLMGSTALLSYRDAEVRLGILPYPLYDTDQENYHALIWNGKMCIPSTIRNIDMVSDTVELLAAYASPVKDAFYEKLLGLKLSEAPDDAEMLDIIWNSQISDVGMTLCNLNGVEDIVYIVPFMCERHNKNYGSFLKGATRSATRSLKAFFDKMDK